MDYRSPYPNELYHHGIKGQKWGIRRFQNPDGTLTAAGKKRYLQIDENGKYQYTKAGKKLKDEAVKKYYGIERADKERRIHYVRNDVSRVVSKLSDEELTKFINDAAAIAGKTEASLRQMISEGKAYTKAFMDAEASLEVSKIALNAATMEEVHRRFHY